jgi:hypothetical protein
MIHDVNKRVLIWRFTLVLIKINYGQIGDQTGLFYTTNPVFFTSGNRFVCRTGTYGNLIFSLVPSDNRNTRSTCPMSVFTGTRQTLMSRPACNFEVNLITHLEVIVFFHQIFKMLILFVLYLKKLQDIKVKFKLQTCSACQDLTILQF